CSPTGSTGSSKRAFSTASATASARSATSTSSPRDLAVTLAGLRQWGDKYLSEKPPRITRRIMRRRSDKRPVIAAFVPKGADVVREDELEIVPSPGLKAG